MREAEVVSQKCVFCAIAEGSAFSRMVFQTDDLVCFFPLKPEVLGHTLIAPRQHVEHISDCPAAFGASLFTSCQTLFRHYATAMDATGFNLMNASGIDANQSVPHLHFHFLPRRKADGLNTWPALPPFSADLDLLLSQLKVETPTSV